MTATQELATVLAREENAELGLRIVQIVVPPSPKVFAIIDPDALDDMTNRTYRLPVVHPGQVIQFKLAPQQSLALACEQGIAEVSLVVECFAKE